MVVLMLKRQIDVQSTQIGTLLALGYTRKEVSFSFMMYPLIISIAGTVLGIASGLIAAGPLTELYTAFYNLPILNRLAFDPVTLIAGFAVPISVLCLAGFLTIRKKSTNRRSNCCIQDRLFQERSDKAPIEMEL